MSNPFERHGIDHLSASSLNLWAAEPALWIMERLLRRRSPSGIPAARGKAVEAGVNIGLLDPALTVEACIAEAESAFDRETKLNPDPRRDDERKKLAGYVRGALAELRQYGPPDADGYQGKVEIRLDDVPVPVIGFVDWRFLTALNRRALTPVRRTSSETNSEVFAIFVGMIARGAGNDTTFPLHTRIEQHTTTTTRIQRAQAALNRRSPPLLGSSRPSTYAGGGSAILC